MLGISSDSRNAVANIEITCLFIPSSFGSGRPATLYWYGRGTSNRKTLSVFLNHDEGPCFAKKGFNMPTRQPAQLSILEIADLKINRSVEICASAFASRCSRISFSC